MLSRFEAGLLSADFARGKRNPKRNQDGRAFSTLESALRGMPDEFVRPEKRVTAVQESGNGGEMVRTKRTTRTQASGKKTKRNAGGNDNVTAIAVAGESLQERQHYVFAKALEDASFGDAPSMRLVTKERDEPARTNESESTGIGFSQAAAWAAEPEWIGEASEETAETGSGRREPEE